MRSSICIAAAGLALMMTGSQASACESPCGYGGYGYAAYAAPPVYAYSYLGAAYGAYPAYYDSYYTARINNIFRGPAWGYSAAYYNTRAGGCRRVRAHRPCHARRGHSRPYRHHMYGPIIRASRRW